VHVTRSTFSCACVRLGAIAITSGLKALAKILLLALGLFVAYWILKGYRKKVERRRDNQPSTSEDMVRCAQCGVHLPRSESLTSGNVFYCSADHRRAHEKTG
jgi:uncharacterized protein